MKIKEMFANPGVMVKFLVMIAAVGFCSNTVAAEKVYRSVYSEPKSMILDDGARPTPNYFGVGFSYTFAGFRQTHLTDGQDTGEYESYLTAVPGFGLLAGTAIGGDWRGEIEAGFISKYSDTRNDVMFSIGTYYVLASGAWDFFKGFHVGGGLGFAASEMKIKSDALFSPSAVSDTKISPMIALGFGYRLPIADKLAIDLSYRFAGFWGMDQTVGIRGTGSDYTSSIGFISNHQVGVAAEYEF
jgi:opacity protein-like surface antigen